MRDKPGAEQTLAKALQLSPVPAEAWTLKATFAYARANAILYGSPLEAYDITDAAPLKAYLDKHTLSPKSSGRQKANLEETTADNEKAIQTAPNQGRLYADRSTLRSMRASQQALLAALQVDQKQIDAAMVRAQKAFGAEFTALRHRRYVPRRPPEQGRSRRAGNRHRPGGPGGPFRRADPNLKGDKLLQSLPDSQRKDAQKFLIRLQSLSGSRDKQTAVSANVYLGAVPC